MGWNGAMRRAERRAERRARLRHADVREGLKLALRLLGQIDHNVGAVAALVIRASRDRSTL